MSKKGTKVAQVMVTARFDGNELNVDFATNSKGRLALDDSFCDVISAALKISLGSVFKRTNPKSEVSRNVH